MQQFSPFNSVQTPLNKGINLIEASAGTGKTFAIAMLVLRFVVEFDIAIDKILVATFTNAATDELKDRVRKRLVEARQLANGGDVDDVVLQTWFNTLKIEPLLIQKRLNQALINIDQAAISTIHGFCRKILREHALESGQLFDTELLDDLSSIKQACVDDFWRKQLYHRSTAQVAILTTHYKTPDALLKSIKDIKDEMLVYPNTENLDELLQRFETLSESAQIVIQNCDAAILKGINEDRFKKEFKEHYPILASWLQKTNLNIPNEKGLTLLTSEGLANSLNGNAKGFKGKEGARNKELFLNELAVDTDVFDQLCHISKRIDLALRCNLIEYLRIELNERLRHLNVLSADQIISHLAEALNSDKKDLLIHELRIRFQAALIDEFQDTDNHQWFIFSTLFNSAEHFLYLIGDPKQAIYKFRGADIYSYIGAQQQAKEKLTLTHNWRSHPKLVDAVNNLFQQKAQAFLLEELVFHPVQAAQTPEKGELHFDNQAIAPMMLWQLMDEDKHWSKNKAEPQVRIAVCNEIIELLNNNYTLHPENRRLQPKDLAILVYTNEQAQEYQNTLRDVGVPSVLKSTRSVFASHEAKELYRLLNAVANPNDLNLLKQALTISWFGFDGQSLYELFKDETKLDEIMLRFVGYYQDWQKLGLMAMLEKLLGYEEIRIKLAQNNRVERQLTNIHHLIELTHQAASDEHLGINKTLDWLQSAIDKSDGSKSETQQLRLESDEDAVQIITMHRSKGLEYAVAFCPCLWQEKESKDKELAIAHENGNIVADLGSPDFEKRAEKAKEEQDAENARLCYVALTRAKYRCYLVWVNSRTAKDKPNQSALAQLLQLSELDYIEQQTLLKNLSENNSFAYQEIPANNQLTGSYKKRLEDLELNGFKRSRLLYSNWQMSSYTALSALSEHNTPELPQDKAREALDSTVVFNITDELPKGAHTGNVIHDLLENHDFYKLGQGSDITEARDKACLKYSLTLERPEIINEVLLNVVQTPLSHQDNEFCLINIKDEDCLKEMPFYLNLQELNTQKINAILKDSPAYQVLNYKTLSGYLTGFIDLICQYNGKFYVMDYKTNYLLDYKPEYLTLAMREHNYGLQYWLYTVVLHRYLQNRLPNYDYQHHFGGVRYLFVRGMQPDIKMSGVYQDMPDIKKVEALAELFSNTK